MTATITDRDYVLDMLVDAALRHFWLAAIDDPAALADGLADAFGGSFWGGAVLLGPDGRVPAEYMAPEHGYWFQCRKRGVWIGQGAMTRSSSGRPDIRWREVAEAALGHGRQARLF